MNKYIGILICTLCVWVYSIACSAQSTLIDKYPFPPHDYQEVFMDYVSDNPVRIITTSAGQYVGQMDKNSLLCGYGMFVNNDGSQIVGQFNKGKLLFGVTIANSYARVGSLVSFANYSLTKGGLEYISRQGSKDVIDTNGLYDYAFVSMSYPNGDQYVGEIYRQKRHGYGIYYYANGDIWYGEYNNDIRDGYGVLIDKDNNFTIGHWEGEDLRRSIFLKAKNK